MLSWTDERVELLRKLWTDGLSASRIAMELGGVTRNAVIGKVHRLGLSGRVKTTQTQTPKAKKPSAPRAPSQSRGHHLSQGNAALKGDVVPLLRPQAAPAPKIYALTEPPLIENGSILQLTEQTCKWPVGDPGAEGFHFCCRRSDVGIPYCGYHARLAYQPASDRRRERRAAG